MQVSSEAFSRICLTAREISGIAGRDVECMGYLLAEKGSSAVTDFYFPEQHGDDAESGTGDFLYRQFYEDGMNIRGMWHSHGSLPVSHSRIDLAHIRNKLKAMQRENSVLDAWDFYCNPGSIELFSRETMQGLKIALSISYKPQIKKVHELLPEVFLSIVINRETCSANIESYEAMQFSLENNGLRKEKAKIDIQPIMPGQQLESIANNYTISGLLLKDTAACRKKSNPKIQIKNNAVEITSRYGCFSVECDNPNDLAETIEDVKKLSDEELKKHRQNLPKKPNAKESIESIVNEKKKSLLQLNPYEFREPAVEAMQMHAFYLGIFLSSMEFYQRSDFCRKYMHADKAVIDIFAALSGAIEAGNETLMAFFSRIEDAGAPLDIYIGALREAEGIIERHKDIPEKARLLKKINAILKKAKKGAKNGQQAGAE